MAQLLQNINRVEYIETRYLHDIAVAPDNRVLLKFWRNFIKLPIVGLASVAVSDKVADGSRLATIQLTANTCCDFAVNHRKLAWRVTTVTGAQYLIGVNEQPYPVTTVSDEFPDRETERSGKSVHVEWITPLSLLKIID